MSSVLQHRSLLHHLSFLPVGREGTCGEGGTAVCDGERGEGRATSVMGCLVSWFYPLGGVRVS